MKYTMKNRLKKWLIVVVVLLLISSLVGRFCDWITPAPANWQRLNSSMTRLQVRELLGTDTVSNQKMVIVRQKTWFGGRKLQIGFDSADRIEMIGRAYAVWPVSQFAL